MARKQVIASLTILAIIIVAMVAMLRAPLYPRYSAPECLEAYARARTRADTARVDLHPYVPAWATRARHRCGEVRAVHADSAANIVSH